MYVVLDLSVTPMYNPLKFQYNQTKGMYIFPSCIFIDGFLLEIWQTKFFFFVFVQCAFTEFDAYNNSQQQQQQQISYVHTIK